MKTKNSGGDFEKNRPTSGGTTTTLEQRKSEVLALSNDKTPTINKESLDLKDETKTVKVPSGETIGIGIRWSAFSI